jgi:hypothetical protein
MREWDVVAQLAFQIQSKQIDGAADDLLAGLLGAVPGSCTEAKDANILSFAARSLSFLVPTPKMVREVTGRVVTYSISGQLVPIQKSNAGPESPERHVAIPAEMLNGLADAAADNVKVVTRTMIDTILPACLDQSEPVANAALEIGLHLYLAQHWIAAGDVPRESTVAFSLRSAVLEAGDIAERRRELSKRNVATALDAFADELIDIEQLISLHGVSCLFDQLSYRIVGTFSFIPLGAQLILAVVSETNRGWVSEKLAKAGLAAVGRRLQAIGTPWGTLLDIGYVQFLWHEGLESTIDLSLDTDAVWGFVLLWLAFSEQAAETAIQNLLSGLPIIRPTSPAALAHQLVVLRKQSQMEKGAVPDESVLARFGFSEDRLAILRDWMRGRVTFTRRPHHT